jgi:uncharacterized protein with FMN-binding domain
MKNFLVSSIVIVSFVAYSFYQRVFGVQTTPIISSVSPKISHKIVRVTISPTVLPTNTPIPSQPSSRTQSLPTVTAASTVAPPPTVASGYKDGTYTGDAADAFYGNIQVQANISNGKITTIQFLQAPNDRDRSIEINSQADPMLAQEAIQAQSAQVDIISGATDSSQAFVQSLQSALDKAKS